MRGGSTPPPALKGIPLKLGFERHTVSPTETKDSTKREIAVEIPATEVTRETEALIQKYQKLARLPGFRKGHVPASIIRQRFAEDIKTDVVEALVPRYFRQEADKQGLIPVSQPRVTDLHIHDGEPLRFKASFEILPEVKVDNYKELRADKPEITVTDEEVEQALNDLREQHATFAAIEGRPLGEGDFAQSAHGKPSRAKASLCIWTMCWSKLAARTPCPSSPSICGEPRPVTSGPLK